VSVSLSMTTSISSSSRGNTPSGNEAWAMGYLRAAS
jgi:hypothetical protein